MPETGVPEQDCSWERIKYCEEDRCGDRRVVEVNAIIRL
jgi:hypothetical protein